MVVFQSEVVIGGAAKAGGTESRGPESVVGLLSTCVGVTDTSGFWEGEWSRECESAVFPFNLGGCIATVADSRSTSEMD